MKTINKVLGTAIAAARLQFRKGDMAIFLNFLNFLATLASVSTARKIVSPTEAMGSLNLAPVLDGPWNY